MQLLHKHKEHAPISPNALDATSSEFIFTEFMLFLIDVPEVLEVADAIDIASSTLKAMLEGSWFIKLPFANSMGNSGSYGIFGAVASSAMQIYKISVKFNSCEYISESPVGRKTVTSVQLYKQVKDYLHL